MEVNYLEFLIIYLYEGTNTIQLATWYSLKNVDRMQMEVTAIRTDVA